MLSARAEASAGAHDHDEARLAIQKKEGAALRQFIAAGCPVRPYLPAAPGCFWRPGLLLRRRLQVGPPCGSAMVPAASGRRPSQGAPPFLVGLLRCCRADACSTQRSHHPLWGDRVFMALRMPAGVCVSFANRLGAPAGSSLRSPHARLRAALGLERSAERPICVAKRSSMPAFSCAGLWCLSMCPRAQGRAGLLYGFGRDAVIGMGPK
ncbi:unnamed protein product [Amoebophrya sp. A120]|nr:unnamed protein product [Amoebophrya sp. A120]|eukprot:GSA120T00009720001.1